MPPGVHTIRIAPVSLEIAPGKIIKTTGYNGAVPDSALRLKEGQPVKINVINGQRLSQPHSLAWLYLPYVQDGATEEGSPNHSTGRISTFQLYAESQRHTLVSYGHSNKSPQCSQIVSSNLRPGSGRELSFSLKLRPSRSAMTG
jgi:hypothetical protein